MSEIRIYQLVIMYPEGSAAPGWRPAMWSDPDYLRRLSRKARRELGKAGFRWPRERRFLSASGAYDRAWLLRFYGAEVIVERSDPVEWPETVFTADSATWCWHDEMAEFEGRESVS
jgi:hypothetical protein